MMISKTQTYSNVAVKIDVTAQKKFNQQISKSTQSVKNYANNIASGRKQFTSSLVNYHSTSMSHVHYNYAISAYNK